MEHMYDADIGSMSRSLRDWSRLVKQDNYTGAMASIDRVLKMAGDLRVQTAMMAASHEAHVAGDLP